MPLHTNENVTILDDSILDELPPLPKIPPNGRRCNARIRNRRGYCTQSRQAHGNGRCRMHNGAGLSSLAHKMANSRANYLPDELKPRFENLTGDAIDGLEESIKMQHTLETQLWDQMKTGESLTAWQLLNELVPQYEYADTQDQPGIWNRMKSIIQGGLKNYGVRKEIQGIHESQRKLTETLTKCRKEVQETFSSEQWASMMSILLGVLKVEIDTPTLRRVAMAIQRLEGEQKIPAASVVIDVTPKLQEQPNGNF